VSEKWARPAVRLRQLDLDASDDGSFGAFAGCFWEENRANEAAPEIPCKHNYEWSRKNRATASCVKPSAPRQFIHPHRTQSDEVELLDCGSLLPILMARSFWSAPVQKAPPFRASEIRDSKAPPSVAAEMPAHEFHRAAVVNCNGSLHRLQRPASSFIRTRAR